jgi:hypothetical protein
MPASHARKRRPAKRRRVGTSLALPRTTGHDLAWCGTTNIPRLPGDTPQVFTIVQQLPDAQITQVANAVGAVAYQFSFGQLDQYAQLGYIFDQYRFDLIEVTFRPQANANPMTLAAVIVPQLYTAIDYDDGATVSLALIRQYQNCLVSTNETQVRRFTPALAMAAYSGSAFTAYAHRQHQWVDCNSNSVPHYGVKACIDAGATGQTLLQTWNVSFRVRISFQNTR